MSRGKLLSFDHRKGYGFIRSESGEDVFVHCSDVQDGYDDLSEGDYVSFELSTNEKKRAIAVKRISRA